MFNLPSIFASIVPLFVIVEFTNSLPTKPYAKAFLTSFETAFELITPLFIIVESSTNASVLNPEATAYLSL